MTISYKNKPAKVEVVERQSGKVVGIAESSANLNLEGKRVPGRVLITYSKDLSSIVVHENAGDASPNPRYILFQHQKSGSLPYISSYFAPPTFTNDYAPPFNLISPDIESVSKNTLSLKYDKLRKMRVMRISDLKRTHVPTGSQIWLGDLPGVR